MHSLANARFRPDYSITQPAATVLLNISITAVNYEKETVLARKILKTFVERFQIRSSAISDRSRG